MRLLLDTHVLAWWVLDTDALSSKARSAIAVSARILVSAVSAFEMANKHRLGKWPGIGDFIADFVPAMQRENFDVLALTSDHAIRAGLLPGPHRDPFDRLLAAQALTENLVLVTRDPAFAEFGVETLW